MGHALLKKAILLLKIANVPFDLLLAVFTLFNVCNVCYHGDGWLLIQTIIHTLELCLHTRALASKSVANLRSRQLDLFAVGN